MTKKNRLEESHLENKIGFTRALRRNQYLAVSGTAPLEKNGSTVFKGDMYKQAKVCLQIIEDSIRAFGGTLEDVIRTRVMVTDISQWEEVAKAHKEVFKNHQPACTFMEVNGFIDKEWLVEIEADCILLGSS